MIITRDSLEPLLITIDCKSLWLLHGLVEYWIVIGQAPQCMVCFLDRC